MHTLMETRIHVQNKLLICTEHKFAVLPPVLALGWIWCSLPRFFCCLLEEPFQFSFGWGILGKVKQTALG